MKIHRFIIPGINIDSFPGKLEVVDHHVYHQAKNVLKLKIGESIIICDGQGKEGQGIIFGYEKKSILINMGKVEYVKNGNGRKVTLYCALLKKENFETVVQKASEIGIKKIVPIVTGRTVKTNINIVRLSAIALEASELSGRTDVPEVCEPLSYEQAVNESQKNDSNIIFVPGGSDIRKVLLGKELSVGIFIGPEGGWSDDEIEYAGNNKLLSCNLGNNILRGETAAIIASYLAINI